MRCTHCEENNAKYEIRYLSGLNRGSEFLCESCYAKENFFQDKDVQVRPMPVIRCSFCGSTMDDYLQTGLVGCEKCYRCFRTDLQPYIERLQGDAPHIGKIPANGEKQEITLALHEALLATEEARKEGNDALAKKQRRKAEELRLLLFGEED